jgi:Rap1a immunity proteins
MKATMVGALIAVSITAAGAQEYPTDAGRFLPECKAYLNDTTGTSGTAIQGFCGGMVVGMASIAQPLFAPGQSRGTNRCLAIPENVTNRQLIEAVVRYIESRPQRWGEQFRVLAVQALFDAWPCNS